MFAKCINTENPILLIANNIEELANYDLPAELGCYLPNYVIFGNPNIELKQISFENKCTVMIDNHKFIFKFIDLLNL